MKPLAPEEQERRKRFLALEPADQVRLTNSANDQLFQVASVKMAALPGISAIAATLLIVATFNQNLIPLNSLVKLLISILILIVPISLLAFLYHIWLVEEFGQRTIEIYTDHSFRAKGVGRLLHVSPLIFAGVIFVLMCIIVAIVWVH